MKILLAEDAALLREGLIALLDRAGHEVVAAVPTATELETEAARWIPSGDIDLVITDVRMPPDHADDGLRAALRIRDTHPDVPILVLSQYVEQRYASVLLGMSGDTTRPGGTGYLLKDRVSRVHDFLDALEVVRSGGIVVDPTVVSTLMSSDDNHLSVLTAREKDVLELVSRGATNDQISRRLHLSRGAVVKHVSSAFEKLGITAQEGNHRVLAVIAYLRGKGPS